MILNSSLNDGQVRFSDFQGKGNRDEVSFSKTIISGIRLENISNILLEILSSFWICLVPLWKSWQKHACELMVAWWKVGSNIYCVTIRDNFYTITAPFNNIVSVNQMFSSSTQLRIMLSKLCSTIWFNYRPFGSSRIRKLVGAAKHLFNNNWRNSHMLIG